MNENNNRQFEEAKLWSLSCWNILQAGVLY